MAQSITGLPVPGLGHLHQSQAAVTLRKRLELLQVGDRWQDTTTKTALGRHAARRLSSLLPVVNRGAAHLKCLVNRHLVHPTVNRFQHTQT